MTTFGLETHWAGTMNTTKREPLAETYGKAISHQLSVITLQSPMVWYSAFCSEDKTRAGAPGPLWGVFRSPCGRRERRGPYWEGSL